MLFADPDSQTIEMLYPEIDAVVGELIKHNMLEYLDEMTSEVAVKEAKRLLGKYQNKMSNNAKAKLLKLTDQWNPQLSEETNINDFEQKFIEEFSRGPYTSAYDL